MATCSIGDLSRREILKMSALTGIASVVSTKFAMARAALRRTPEQILGPFYPLKPLEQNADLTRIAGRPGRAEGQLLTVMGRVLNLKGEPVRRRLKYGKPTLMGATPIQTIPTPRRSIQTLRDQPF